MNSLGFFVDIRGYKKVLAKPYDARSIQWIADLANMLFDMGCYISNNNIGRLFCYQIGDGFMVQFDRVLFDNGKPCRGVPRDFVSLAIALIQNFLLHSKGLLKIGITEGNDFFGISYDEFKFTKNQEPQNGYECGKGKIYILPVTGLLLADAYALIENKNEDEVCEKHYTPQILLKGHELAGLLDANWIKNLDEDVYDVDWKNLSGDMIQEFHKNVFKKHTPTVDELDNALVAYNRGPN